MQDVQDKKAEIGINLGVIIQGLMLAAILGFGKFAFDFGGYMVDGLEELNANVKELTHEIAQINTITSLNAAEIRHNSVSIGHNASDIEKMRISLESHIKDFPHYTGE